MKGVEGKRVGVRWKPPALIYVYQQGHVLRKASLPIRNLENEDVVDELYKRHGFDLLRGLERRYVERMVNILRHHHGLEPDNDGQTDKTASEKQSDKVESGTESEIQKASSISPSDPGKTDQLRIPSMSLIGVQNDLKSSTAKGTDLLKLLNQASKSVEDNEVTVIDNNDKELKSDVFVTDKIDASNKQNKDKTEIVTLIKEDLNSVKKERQSLEEILNQREDLTNLRKLLLDDPKNPEDKSGVTKHPPVDDSEDTDLDLDDVDIPLDPEQPKRIDIDLLDDDDFWS